MSHKLLPRLGSAIASTILSYAALSLVGVDKAQAATLTYDFRVGIDTDVGGFFQVNNSSLTGIGVEKVPVYFGVLQGFDLPPWYRISGSNSLSGAGALFYQGEFRGLEVEREKDSETNFKNRFAGSISWSFALYPLDNPSMWTSRFSGYIEQISLNNQYGYGEVVSRRQIDSAPVSYTLVSTEPEPVGEPVPEPLTAGGTALALAGLSWLKHKKKMAA